MNLFKMSAEFQALSHRIVVGHLGNGRDSRIERGLHKYTCSHPQRFASIVSSNLVRFLQFPWVGGV